MNTPVYLDRTRFILNQKHIQQKNITECHFTILKKYDHILLCKYTELRKLPSTTTDPKTVQN